MIRRLSYILPSYVVLYVACWFVAYCLRFDFSVPRVYRELLWDTILLAVAVKLGTNFATGDWRRSFRYATIGDLVHVVLGVTGASAVLFLLNLVAFAERPIPRSVLLIDWMLNVVGFTLLRAGVRFGLEAWRNRRSGADLERAVILGATPAGIGILKTLEAVRPRFRVVGFVEEDDRHGHAVFSGVRVFTRTRHDWALLASRHKVRHLLVPTSTTGRRIRDIVRECTPLGIQVHVIPEVSEIVDGRFRLAIREVDISDLLRREPNRLDLDAVRECVSGRRVLVTGAAGSIGSELCRQIADLSPAELVLFDQSESGIFEIEQELRHRPGVDASLHFVVADILDADALDQTMREHRPEIVFHAAAYKHVPLMESNPREAVRNNVLGTRAVVEHAQRHGVDRFVLISTDKAVHPTNVMGATKFLAEKCVQAASGTSGTQFVTVRFGNVLGSSGSVVPLFRRQIVAGGPVTVTHPEMTRFFMTIPEAVQLVLQAAAIGSSGDVLILDMGEPVRIVDLAKDMILLSGLRYPEDIDIVFTGIRPGEKLAEQLFYGSEDGTRRVHEKIRCATRAAENPLRLRHDLARLEEAVQGSQAEARAVLDDIVARRVADQEPGTDSLRKAA